MNWSHELHECYFYRLYHQLYFRQYGPRKDFCDGQLLANIYAVARPSVCLSSVTLVRPTQAVEIFGNISTAFGTVAIH